MEPREIARKVINKEKWWDMLSRFIDVLRINVFIVDVQGKIILPPEESKYGGRLFTERSLGFNLHPSSSDFIGKFKQEGYYLESSTRYGLRCFAVPIELEHGQPIAYMIVGPVIMNKRLSSSYYQEIAQKHRVNGPELLDEINEIRVVSNVMINSILDLLAEIVRDTIELNIKEKELDRLKADASPSDQSKINDKVNEMAREIYSDVRLDELLVTLLDVALKMTATECGSIMVIDKKNEVLTIKASRGLEEKMVRASRVFLGEGIAGVAAMENSSFVIKGTKGDNRIKKYLKRPEIKHALVMPIVAKDKVFGVLNLHTKNENSRIDESLTNLQHLTRLVSSAV